MNTNERIQRISEESYLSMIVAAHFALFCRHDKLAMALIEGKERKIEGKGQEAVAKIVGENVELFRRNIEFAKKLIE